MQEKKYDHLSRYTNLLLEIVASAVQPSFPDETSFAVLVQEHVTLAATQAPGVPLQVGRDVECELVLDRQFAAVTDSAFLVCPFNCAYV